MKTFPVGFLLLLQCSSQLQKTLFCQDALCLVGIKAHKHTVYLLIPCFQLVTFPLHFGSIRHIPTFHVAGQPLIKYIRIFQSHRRQILYVFQHKIIQVPCFDLVAGAGVLPQPVISLADIVCLVYRLPLFPSKPVLPGSPDLLITHLHGFSACSAIDNAMKKIVKRAGVPFHNCRPAVNDLLHLFPLRRCDDCFMAALDHFPVLTGNDIVRIGTDTLLMRPADQMCAFIKGIPQDMADPCAAPRIVVHITFRIGFYPCDRHFVIHQLLCYPHVAPAIQRKFKNPADYRRSFGVNNQMPFLVRVTHQPQRRLPSAELPLSGTGHAPCQHLFGNITAVHAVQDIFERRNVHFLPCQAVHPVRDCDIPYIVLWEKDFDITACFDIVPPQPG